MAQISDQKLAAILGAFTQRLTPASFETIARAREEQAQAAMHYGLSAQLESHQNLERAAVSAISDLIEHDKENISRLILDALGTRIFDDQQNSLA